jgi:hypothetical protein
MVTERTAGTSVIMIVMLGGPSQLETWDPKPDAESEIRGPFGSIATRVPGVRISEHLPRLATRMDRLALVRSMHHDSAPIHETGLQLLQTGRLCRFGEENPHFGAVLDHLAQASSREAGFAVIPGPIGFTGIDLGHGQSAGWLDVAPSAEVTGRKPSVSVFEEAYRQSTLGQNLYAARQLLESGVRCVTVNMFDTVFERPTWDCHGTAPFSNLDDYARRLLPEFDHAVSTLIDDLEHAGRLESTLIVAAGEFGRTPRLNPSGGRDHWPSAWTVMLAGGGIRGGTVIGATDAHGGAPIDQPITPMDLLATIYRSQGVDPNQAILRPDGRPYRLVENGRPISGLLA